MMQLMIDMSAYSGCTLVAFVPVHFEWQVSVDDLNTQAGSSAVSFLRFSLHSLSLGVVTLLC